MAPQDFITDYSNRFLILNEFTKSFINLNKLNASLNYYYFKKGNSSELMKFITKALPYIIIIKNYLEIFIEEEKAKRKNKETLENLHKELNNNILKIKQCIAKAEVSLKKQNFRQYKEVIKEFMEELEKFFKIISKLNTILGLFSKEKSFGSLKDDYFDLRYN